LLSLQQLVDHTDQIFDIPKEKRTALIKVIGQFSRKKKKDGRKIQKEKKAVRDKHARKEYRYRNST